jgi:hypothetical protein
MRLLLTTDFSCGTLNAYPEHEIIVKTPCFFKKCLTFDRFQRQNMYAPYVLRLTAKTIFRNIKNRDEYQF